MPSLDEELLNANLLRERGDLLMKDSKQLSKAESCFKKALQIARRFPDDDRASDVCFACNLGIAHIGTMKWTINASSRAAKTSRAVLDAGYALTDRPQTHASRPMCSTSHGAQTQTARLTARQTTSTSRMTQRDVVDEGKEVEVDEAPRQPTAVSGANEAPRQPTAVSGANEVRTDWILKTGKQKITIQEAEALKASLGMTRSKRHLEVTNPDPRFRVWGPCGNMGVPPEMVLANLRNNLTHSWGPKPVDVVRKCRVREGYVTKRMRMDRDRLARNSGAFNHTGGIPAKSAAFFRPIPLAVVQRDKQLVGVPLQRTYPGS